MKGMRSTLVVAMLGIVAACGRNLDLADAGADEGGAADAAIDVVTSDAADAALIGRWNCSLQASMLVPTQGDCQEDREKKGCHPFPDPDDKPCRVGEPQQHSCSACRPVLDQFSYELSRCDCEPEQ
jgi:hypothetical protein